VTFYAWLSSQPETYAFLLKRYDEWRIPPSTNKLCKLLRFIDKRSGPHPVTRACLKKAHRGWRAYLAEQEKNFVKIDIEAIPNAPFDDIVALSGLKPIGDFTINGRWVPNDPPAHTLSAVSSTGKRSQTDFYLVGGNYTFNSLILDKLLDFPPPPERWERVYRRWSFKHRGKCARCNATTDLVRLMLGRLVICRDAEECEAREAFELSTKLCPECKQPHNKNQYMNFPILCDVCFTKTQNSISFSKDNEQD
jgi:hypothetical protein